MDKIIIIDDRTIKQELESFLRANKNHIRLHSDMDELSLGSNPLLNELIKQYEEKHKLKIQSKDKVHFFKSNDIIRLESLATKTKIYLMDGRQKEIDENINIIEKQLTDFPFLRTHPRHIVNLHFISKISNQTDESIELTDGSIVPATDQCRILIIDFINKHYQ